MGTEVYYLDFQSSQSSQRHGLKPQPRYQVDLANYVWLVSTCTRKLQNSKVYCLSSCSPPVLRLSCILRCEVTAIHPVDILCKWACQMGQSNRNLCTSSLESFCISSTLQQPFVYHEHLSCTCSQAEVSLAVKSVCKFEQQPRMS